jgi:hypothetical protein
MTLISDKLAVPQRLALRLPAVPVFFFLLLWAAALLRILALTGGHFSYTLDDPYIHLALSERLAHLHYGINLDATSSPSSSILWPFLLVPAVGTAWHAYLPLAINLVCGLASAWLIGHLVEAWPWRAGDTWRGAKIALISCLLVLATNLIGLAFMGMENGPNVLVALGCAYGMIESVRGRAIPLWSLWLAALSPILRYEDFVLVLAMAACLVGQRRFQHAAGLCAASLVIPSLFGVYLMAHALPPLPTSLLVKTASLDHKYSLLVNLPANALQVLRGMPTRPESWAVLALIVALGVVAWRARETARIWVAAGAVLALAGFICGGQYDGYFRYDPFIVAFGYAVLLGIVGAQAVRHWRLAAAAILLGALPYIGCVIDTPLAAQNIYEQQYQMHRFVQDYYRQDFAVNDLGWVSYGLDPKIRVLDLKGLGSYEAASRLDKDAPWLTMLTRRERVGLAMIYREWFSSIPADWTAVAELWLSGRDVTPFAPRVMFYATPSADLAALKRELLDFSATLPPGVRLVLDPVPGG